MKKIWNFLKDSQHWLHIICGIIIAIPFSIFSGLYTVTVTALAVEYKDKAWGGTFDWKDLLCTIGGGCLTTIVKTILILCNVI